MSLILHRDFINVLILKVKSLWRLLVRKDNDKIGRALLEVFGAGNYGKIHSFKNLIGRFRWRSEKIELCLLTSWSRKGGAIDWVL